ncbi:hypothetical protein MRM75_15640 [bacterium 19CA06SA08-2]|uniref:Uncharacterized protein n=1 Tax=bacterium 19CA06SA08-2 TaxID=2920658 RepID=A0AAU6U2D5_UNCXX
MPGILLFLVAFDPQVPFLPNGIGFTFLVALFLFPIFFIGIQNKSFCDYFIRKFNGFYLLFSAALLFILIRLTVNGGDNFIFILSWFKAFFVFLACYFVFIIFYSKKSVSYFALNLLFVYLINGVVNFLWGSFPSVFEFLRIFQGEVISDSLGKNPYRNSFISGSGYYSIGTAYGLIFLLLVYHLATVRPKSLIFSFGLSVSLIAGVFAARTSLLAIIPALIYLFKTRVVYSLLAAGFTVGIATSLWPLLEPYANWILSFFNAVEDASGSHLIKEMFFWPGEYVFLFGMGAVNDGAFVYTDSGYMQDILFGGIVFLLMKISFLAVFTKLIIKRHVYFCFSLIFATLLFHFKGLFFYNNAQGMAAFYFSFFYFLKLEYERRNGWNG